MAHTKLPEATVERLLKCQRWGGVCDEGTADLCAVALKTVHIWGILPSSCLYWIGTKIDILENSLSHRFIYIKANFS
jgi:hypothetical protein